jgi:hypothetical protein
LELPLENPVLCRRRTCTNSSLDRLFIWRAMYFQLQADTWLNVARTYMDGRLLSPASCRLRSHWDWSLCPRPRRGTWSPLDRTPCRVPRLLVRWYKSEIFFMKFRGQFCAYLAAAWAVSNPPVSVRSLDQLDHKWFQRSEKGRRILTD